MSAPGALPSRPDQTLRAADWRALSRRARELLHPGGALVIEHGEFQGADMRGLLTADGWRAAATHRDLLGRDRVTTALR